MSYLNFLQGEEIREKPKKTTNYDRFLQTKSHCLFVKEDSKKVDISTPKDFDDIEKLIDSMKKGNGLVIDISKADEKIAQRMIDFLVGAVYALDGKIESLTATMYLMTPKGIDIIAKADRNT